MIEDTSILESMPSNIAVIKYMGKSSAQDNLPTNSSLSWTLNELRTFVRVSRRQDFSCDQWAPLKAKNLVELHMSERSIQRFIKHFQNLKSMFGVQDNFLIESANNFPSDCGLASSASSFAALTKAAIHAFQALGYLQAKHLDPPEMAELSRKGSGSSCRSFFGPWAKWDAEGVTAHEYNMKDLLHQVIVIEAGKKSVSSSEAHLRVGSSPHFLGRPERAERRLKDLLGLMQAGVSRRENWQKAYQIIWDEFMDMHQLFETCEQPFTYMLDGTRNALRYFENLWKKSGDGPWVTMDAGANIHLLFRAEQMELFDQIYGDMSAHFQVFSSLKSGTQ